VGPVTPKPRAEDEIRAIERLQSATEELQTSALALN
jgi:hypothetical protein